MGALPSSNGYVKIQFSRTTLQYDPVGGAGGQGGIISIEIRDIVAPVVATLQSPGQGGGLGTSRL